MTTRALRKIRPVQLNYHSEENSVVVTSSDEDRFQIQKDRAIEVLQQAKNADDFSLQLRLLLNILGALVRDHRNGLSAAYLTLHDGALSFVAVMHGVKYDAELEDRLSDLDLEIANDPQLDLIRLNTSLMPRTSEEALASFLDEDFVLTYNGFRERSPQSGEQEP
jgi:hypothetical protein